MPRGSRRVSLEVDCILGNELVNLLAILRDQIVSNVKFSF